MSAFVYSQQCSWLEVHTFVTPLLTAAGSWPLIGSPGWVDLDNKDARKRAAIYDAAQHWALRLECGQAALAEASRDVSGAADWSAIATEMVQRHGAYIPRAAS